MSNLRYLHQLLHQLNPSEARILKRSLEQSTEKPGKKQPEFFEMLLQNPYEDEYSLHKRLNLSYETAQIHYLVRCLTERVYDVFLMDTSITCRDTYDTSTRALLIVKKRILQIHTLWQKQQRDRIGLLLSQAEKIAHEYELFAELAELLTMRQDFLGAISGLRVYLDLQSQIQQADALATQLKVSRQLARGIMLSPTIGRNGCLDVSRVAAVIETNDLLLQNAASKLLQYYNLLLQLGMCQTHANGRAAHQICLQLEALTIAEDSIFTDELIGDMYLHFAYHAMHQGDILACKQYLDKTALWAQASAVHKTIVMEMKFLCALHTHDFVAASQALVDLQALTDGDNSPDHVARIAYYQACLYFKCREYSEAQKLMNAAPKFKPEHIGWETALRFLKLMALVENRHTDALEQEIESLRKHLEKCRKEPHHHARWDLMLTLTKRLFRTGFDFKKLTELQTIEMLQLTTDKPPYRWIPTGPELVPFHEWLLDKLLQSQQFLGDCGDYSSLATAASRKRDGSRKDQPALKDTRNNPLPSRNRVKK